MAAKRPTGPLPMGNKAGLGNIARPQTFPGAGQRPPQRALQSGAPRGVLPSRFGAAGLARFKSGRTSIKRSFSPLTRPRMSPFFTGVPPAALVSDRGSAVTDEAFGPPVSDLRRMTDMRGPFADAADRARASGNFVKVRGREARKSALLLFKKARMRQGGA